MVGDVLECCSNHLAARSVRPISLYSIQPFLQINLWKIASAARNLINSFSQTAATTFAASSVFILLIWLMPLEPPSSLENLTLAGQLSKKSRVLCWAIYIISLCPRAALISGKLSKKKRVFCWAIYILSFCPYSRPRLRRT